MKKKIVIFASGSGTNAENIITHFKSSPLAEVVLVMSNKADAFVLQRAKNHGIPAKAFTKEELLSPQGIAQLLQEVKPDLIVLAGFLWKFPSHLVQAFPNKIINIHPALLPRHGGKGMYGNHVHQAVLNHKDAESGISIHYVNEAYDEGAIILQKSVAVAPDETAESLAQKIHRLEYEWFPKVIEELLLNG